MIPTISEGSFVRITKQFDALDYGDIVILNYTEITKEFYGIQRVFIFRVMGLPGDSIAVSEEFCVLNGRKNAYRLIEKNVSDKDLDKDFENATDEYEEFLPNGKNIRIYRVEFTGEYFKIRMPDFYEKYGDRYVHQFNDMDAVKVPENHYFLMGDFRSNAHDSRIIGTIPREQILGKVIEIKPPKKKKQ